LLSYLKELTAFNITLKAPSILYSTSQFTIQQGALVVPLHFIKGINKDFAQRIAKAKHDRPFKDFFDCILRFQQAQLSLAQMQALIDAGSLDDMYPSRASMRASLPNALKNAAILSTFEDDQGGLIPPENFPKMSMIDVVDNLDENLKYEQLVLPSFIVTSLYERIEQPKGFPQLSPLDRFMNQKGIVTTVGMIKQARVIQTKTKQTMAFMSLIDGPHMIECVIFPKLYELVSSLLVQGKVVAVHGKADVDKPNTFLIEQLIEVSL
jgi:DNA polymerase-3 subunit alpha